MLVKKASKFEVPSSTTFRVIAKKLNGSMPPPPPQIGLKLLYGSSNFANNPFNIPNIQLQSEVWGPTGEIKISRATDQSDSGKYTFISPPHKKKI